VVAGNYINMSLINAIVNNINDVALGGTLSSNFVYVAIVFIVLFCSSVFCIPYLIRKKFRISESDHKLKQIRA